MKQSLHIVHLYPKEMNIYGDTGNRLVLQKRAEWRGIEVKLSLVGVGDSIPSDADIILGGGGQDAGQEAVQELVEFGDLPFHLLGQPHELEALGEKMQSRKEKMLAAQ